MKATDLMIGDWVRQKHSGLKLQVSEIRPPYILAECKDGQFHEDTIEPIPITPEILEKNGFEKYPYANSYWYCDDMLELFVKIVCIFPIKDRELRSLLQTPSPRLTAGEDNVYIRCDYVHELQHALKLCGIEKEIVL